MEHSHIFPVFPPNGSAWSEGLNPAEVARGCPLGPLPVIYYSVLLCLGLPAGAASSEVLLQLSPGSGSRRHPGPAPHRFRRLHTGGFHFGHAAAAVAEQRRAGPGVLLHPHLHLDHRAAHRRPLHRRLPPSPLPHRLLPGPHAQGDTRRVRRVLALGGPVLLVARAVAQPARDGRRGRGERPANGGPAHPGVGPLRHRLPPPLHRLLLPQRRHRAQAAPAPQLLPPARLLHRQDHGHPPRHHLHLRRPVGAAHPHDPLPLLLAAAGLAERRPAAPRAHRPGEHAGAAQHRGQLLPLLLHQQALPGHGGQRAEGPGPLPEAAAAVLRQPQLLHHEQPLDLAGQLPLHQDVGVSVRQKREAHLYLLLSPPRPPAAVPPPSIVGERIQPFCLRGDQLCPRAGLLEAWKCQHARRTQRSS